MMVRRVFFAWVLVLLVSGCGPNRYQRRHDASAPAEITRRFAYEFECPEAEIRTTVLSHDPNTEWISTMGADGCGRRAVYVWASGSWVLNSAEGERVSVPDE